MSSACEKLKRQKIVFRCDSGFQIGTGHVQRCLTLARALAQGGAEVVFLCRPHPGHVGRMIEAAGFGLHMLSPPNQAAVVEEQAPPHAAWLGATQAQDAAECRTILVDNAPFDWLIVDHYALDSRWESALRDMTRKILVLDDLADRPHDCDLLLDQSTLQDSEARYAGLIPAYARSLLGPRYALLRPEFAQERKQAVIRTGSIKRLLLSFGGQNLHNITGHALAALAPVADRFEQIEIIMGAHSPHVQEVQQQAEALPNARCYLDVHDMARRMRQADLALGAAGATSWERCCLGLPCLVVCLAENQRGIIADLAERGAILNLGEGDAALAALPEALRQLNDHPEQLVALSTAAMEICDGEGVNRVVKALHARHSISLRYADIQDSACIYQWRNHPSIRAFMFNSQEISWSNHQKWFEGKLFNPDCLILMGVDTQGKPFGTVRFDLKPDQGSACISIFLDPQRLNQGLGKPLLAEAEKQLCKDRSDIRYIQAEVLPQNTSSHALFRKGGYGKDGQFYIKRLRMNMEKEGQNQKERDGS